EATVSGPEIDAALERLRDQSVDFVDIPERGLEMDDFAVIDFEGSSDGTPISEIAPQAGKNPHGGQHFWLQRASDTLLQKVRQRAKQAQVVKYLHERIQFELPPALLKNETRSILVDLVQRNRERGVTDEMLKDKEKELIESAAGLAAHRLKTNFILHRISEQENINVSGDDINARLREEAARYNVAVEKIRKELQEHDGLDAFAEQILLGKTLDFLKANVSVETAQEPAVKEEKS